MMTHKTGPNRLPPEIGLGFDHAVVQTALGSRNHKHKNEDSYWPCQEVSRQQPHCAIDYLIAGRLYIVADGVSGALAGHEASELAVRTIAESYYATLFQLARPPKQDDIVYALQEAISEANRVLLHRSDEFIDQYGLTDQNSLQAAVICVLLRNQTATIANVGDCHLYRYTPAYEGNFSRKKTVPDHLEPDGHGQNGPHPPNPPVPELVEGLPIVGEGGVRVEGQIELLSQPDHSTRYFLGANLQRDQISIYQKRLSPQDILLLCTDGLYTYLAADHDAQKASAAMLKIFQRHYDSGGIKRVAHHLLEQANDAHNGGGRDNITLMMIERPLFTQKSEAVNRYIFPACSEREEDSRPWDGVVTLSPIPKQIQPPPSQGLFGASHRQYELIKGAWGLTEGLTEGVNGAPHPIIVRLGQMAEQLAHESTAPEQKLWLRRATQLGVSIGQAEWQEAQALSYQLGFDFEQNFSTVKQIWALYDQAPSHPQLAKLAFDAVVDLANTALLSADSKKEAMLWQAFNLLSPLRDTLFQQIDQADATYGQEVLLQLEQELAEVKPDLTIGRKQRPSFRDKKLVLLMMGTALILLCLWIAVLA